MTTSSLKQFREEIERASKYSASINAFNQGDVEAREGLETLVNNVEPGLLNVRDSDSLVLRHASKHARRYTRLADQLLERDGENIIDEAKKKHGDNFAKNYLDLPAVKTGVDKFDEVYGLHMNYNALRGAIAELEQGDKTITLANFVAKTAKIIEADVKSMYPDDKEGIAKLIMATYMTSSPQDARNVAIAVAGKLKSQIEEALPENQRANYAAAVMKKLAGDKKSRGIVRDRLYDLTSK